MQETEEMQVRSLGQEDPLEEGTATHASILAWRIPWTEEPGGLQSMGSQKSWTQLRVNNNGLNTRHLFRVVFAISVSYSWFGLSV